MASVTSHNETARKSPKGEKGDTSQSGIVKAYKQGRLDSSRRNDVLRELFKSYAKFGDESRNRGRVLCRRNLELWFSNSGVMSRLGLNRIDLEDYFCQSTPNGYLRWVNPTFWVLHRMLEDVTRKRGVTLREVQHLLASCAPPTCDRAVKLSGSSDIENCFSPLFDHWIVNMHM